MAADTSSSAAASSCVVAAAADWFAALSADPIPVKLVAAASTVSGDAITKDIAWLLVYKIDNRSRRSRNQLGRKDIPDREKWIAHLRFQIICQSAAGGRRSQPSRGLS